MEISEGGEFKLNGAAKPLTDGKEEVFKHDDVEIFKYVNIQNRAKYDPKVPGWINVYTVLHFATLAGKVKEERNQIRAPLS